MSNLINPKPRFGYNPTVGSLYDYVAQRDIHPPLPQRYAARDGVWDLEGVKLAILNGTNLEDAHLSMASLKAEPALNKAVSPPQGSFLGTPATGEAVSNSGGLAPTAVAGLSSAQLIALKLSPIQAAALQLTPTQMTSTGVTAAQVKGWGINAARADALKLTDEQRAVLLP